MREPDICWFDEAGDLDAATGAYQPEHDAEGHQLVQAILDRKAGAADAPDIWSDAYPPGGYVCETCGTPTESEPCQAHQPAAWAAMT